MSLRVKTIFILLSVFALYGALYGAPTYLVQQKVVLPSFVLLEQEEATTSMNRVLGAIDREIDVSTVIADIDHRPSARVVVEVPRDITARGQDAMSFAMASLIGVGIVVLLVLMALLQRTVFRPVTLLTRHVVRIGDHDDLNSRVALDRRDDIQGFYLCHPLPADVITDFLIQHSEGKTSSLGNVAAR